MTVSTANLAAGLYMVKMSGINEQTTIKKLVVNK
jgi:hypothetical protein